MKIHDTVVATLRSSARQLARRSSKKAAPVIQAGQIIGEG
jgi:hypothetical protein